MKLKLLALSISLFPALETIACCRDGKDGGATETYAQSIAKQKAYFEEKKRLEDIAAKNAEKKVKGEIWEKNKKEMESWTYNYSKAKYPKLSYGRFSILQNMAYSAMNRYIPINKDEILSQTLNADGSGWVNEPTVRENNIKEYQKLFTPEFYEEYGRFLTADQNAAVKQLLEEFIINNTEFFLSEFMAHAFVYDERTNGYSLILINSKFQYGNFLKTIISGIEYRRKNKTTLTTCENPEDPYYKYCT
ncbi:hypothetical protein GCL60_02650 [Silvanigrella paludirubra]|uniref:Uncharacterized protein n=1 Tax=Silvanigrella paludirubra TaxID=2499159 RepID=A0A6N6VW23_9BACT|nr:hypothetical protein [Silvanigrella paludirubra]KAB8040845.1 hypothetical protein GCL60_02650 [Silvanigrella paludirubra]